MDFAVADSRVPAASSLTIEFLLLNEGTPAATPVDGSVTIFGVDGSIDAAPAILQPGESIQVTVTDSDEDRTGAADAVEIRYTNGAQRDTLQATETGPTSGVFTHTINVVFSLASTSAATSSDGVIQAKAGDQVVACYDDSLDAAGNTVERCDVVQVIGGVDGDIAATVVIQPGDPVWVRVIDADLNANSSATETVDVTVENVATAETATITLTETGVDSEAFFGSVATVFGTVPGPDTDAVIVVQKGDTLRATYADGMTAIGGTSLQSGDAVTVDPLGDSSGNGAIRAFDAALILEHAVGIITLTDYDSLSANVDLAAPYGPITAFDASLVLQHRVGLIVDFPVQDADAANHPQPETGAAPKRAVDERELLLAAATDYVSLNMTDLNGIVSGDLMVAGFRGEVRPGASAGADILIATHQRDAGLRIAFAVTRPLTGSGELLRLYPAIGEAASSVAVVASFNDGWIRAFLEALPAPPTPTRFELHANAPNPFNPQTTIGFALPAAGQVRLEVLNELGQHVRTLLDGPLEAGEQRAVWDARDDAGTPVAAGLYFYRLSTPQARAVRKMVLLK